MWHYLPFMGERQVGLNSGKTWNIICPKCGNVAGGAGNSGCHITHSIKFVSLKVRSIKQSKHSLKAWKFFIPSSIFTREKTDLKKLLIMSGLWFRWMAKWRVSKPCKFGPNFWGNFWGWMPRFCLGLSCVCWSRWGSLPVASYYTDTAQNFNVQNAEGGAELLVEVERKH